MLVSTHFFEVYANHCFIVVINDSKCTTKPWTFISLTYTVMLLSATSSINLRSEITSVYQNWETISETLIIDMHLGNKLEYTIQLNITYLGVS